MPATTAGTKTVTQAASPKLTAAYLTTLMATPLELLTVAQLGDIKDAIDRIPHGAEPGDLIGALLE